MSPAPSGLFPTSATGVAVLGNGDIAVSGGNGGNNAKFEVSLYDPSGSLLWTQTPFSGVANAVAVTPGGNIVAAGFESTPGTCMGQTPAVTEYTTAGTVVSNFPVFVSCPGSTGAFHGVAVDPGGTIVAAGTELAVATQTFVSWIPSTGTAGTTVTQTDPAQSDGLAVAAPVSGGRVYVAGDNSATQQASIAAFTSSGLDTTWGSSGVAALSAGRSANGIAVSGSPGTIYAAGLGSSSAGFVSALNSTGTSVTWSDNSTGTLTSVAFQPFGSVVTAAGYTGSEASKQMFVEQFNALTGAHNSSFGAGGVMTASMGGPSNLSALAAQPDGKVVGAGGAPSVTPGNTSLALTRFYGPSISVETPPLYQTSTTGNHLVSFRVDLDEPLFSTITPGFSAPGATVSGPVTFGPGVTSVIVTVTVNVVATRTDQFQWLIPSPGNGVAPALNGSNGAAYVTIQPIPAYPGYRMVARDGGIFTFGGAGFYGSMGGHALNAPIIGTASTLNGGGYWLVASDGGIFSFNAPFYGSMGGHALNAPIVGMAADPATGGYWLVASDGGIFSFNAPFLGSMGGHRLNAPIVGMAATADGGGYWLVARDGGIFTFGNAAFLGSMGGHHLNAPVVGMAAYPSVSPYQQGYWLVASDGGIFTFGAAPFRGSMGGHYLVAPILGITPTANGQGYWMVAGDGGIFTFNAGFYGSEGGHYLNAPVVGMSR